MMLIIFIGTFYLVLGCLFLIIPLLFTELGRPKDLIKSGLIILLGIFLLVYKNIFNLSIGLILTLNAVIVFFNVIEVFTYRWNQLLDKEKFEIKSLNTFKNNFFLILNIIKNGLQNLFFLGQNKMLLKKNSIKKKWVRNEKNTTELTGEVSSFQESGSKIQATNFSKEDIINDDKNITKNIKSDKK